MTQPRATLQHDKNISRTGNYNFLQMMKRLKNLISFPADWQVRRLLSRDDYYIGVDHVTGGITSVKSKADECGNEFGIVKVEFSLLFLL